ncbi:MAG: hypothetical protein IKJ04_04440, partial [Clostridia bacterium]|nr:hypothetical protein [Clostridia bacterium]
MKRYLALILTVVMLLPLIASCGPKRLDEPVELIIANDIHYISPEINGYTLEDVSGAQYHMPSD